MENSKYATGRRKTSIAKVWLSKGSGKIMVNDVPLINEEGTGSYFKNKPLKFLVQVFYIFAFHFCSLKIWGRLVLTASQS